MSDTPETDNLARGNHVVPTEFAQELERQRNEAREMAEDLLEKNAKQAVKLVKWRECADMLAFAVSLESKQTIMNWRAFAQDGLAQFERLKEDSK